MRSRARVVQGNTTVGSSQRAIVASVAAVRCPCSATSSLSSSAVGGVGFAGRSSSPAVNSQVRHRSDVPLDSAAASLTPTGIATAVLAARTEPSTARRVTRGGQALVPRPYLAITEPQSRQRVAFLWRRRRLSNLLGRWRADRDLAGDHLPGEGDLGSEDRVVDRRLIGVEEDDEGKTIRWGGRTKPTVRGLDPKAGVLGRLARADRDRGGARIGRARQAALQSGR